MSDLIDFDVNVLRGDNGGDLLKLEKKIANNTTLSKFVLFLGFRFFKEKCTFVTMKDANTFLKMNGDYVNKIGDDFANHEILKKVKQGRKNIFVLQDEKILENLVKIAKKTLELKSDEVKKENGNT